MDNRNKNVEIEDIDILPDPEQDPETLPEEVIEDEPDETEPEKKEVIEEEFDEEDEEEDEKDKKIRDTASEASVLHFKNQKLTDTIKEAKSIPEPTLEELKAYAKEQGADYDELDNFSQNILKKTYMSEKRFEKIQNVSDEAEKIDVWAKKVDEFIEASINSPSPKYPSLATLGKEFKRFAMRETRRGVGLDDLVGSFLYDIEKNVPRNKRSLLLSGGNGSAIPPKPVGLTEDQVATIRVRDPKRYRQLIKAGKINLEI